MAIDRFWRASPIIDFRGTARSVVNTSARCATVAARKSGNSAPKNSDTLNSSWRAEVENEFSRAVTREGNVKAQNLVAEVFELRKSFEWRGLNEVPYSALRIKAKYAAFDAERRFGIEYKSVADNKACECGAILRGLKRPQDCKLFGTVCTPENPMGSCMVSSEGACAAHYTYGRYKDAVTT